MADVLGDFRRLRIRNFFDESGADAHRLVEVFATLGTTVTGDFDRFVGISCYTPLWIMTVLSSESAAGGSNILVFVVLRGRGLTSPRPSLTGRCMRIFVYAKTCFEFFYPLVLLVKLLLQLIDLLVFPLAFLLKSFDPLLKLKQPRKELFFDEIVCVHRLHQPVMTAEATGWAP
ncbi:hypothetical protein C492_11100 [Natronococcus jeotgali DSM 18795]|uniref:Uncharacterized protein n=1 Tax=Natronococcus jeotgali DSM 18795 TaxID=1227498 RepID=L9XCV2_9EURY|nr:hypothetical protein C492_11100 [Natronococcus jeotgali DSM 18795]